MFNNKKRKQISVVSGLIIEIKDLDKIVNNSETPVPGVTGKIKDIKDRLEIEVEREDMERAKLAFAKMSLEGEKPNRFFCSLEKQMKKTTLLESVMIQNKEGEEKDCFNQSEIE